MSALSHHRKYGGAKSDLGILLLGCIAFGIFWSSGLFFRADVTLDATILHYSGRIAKIITCYLIAFVAWRYPIQTTSMFRLATGFMAVAIIFSLAYIISPTASLTLGIVANIFHGLAGAFYTLLFAEFFSLFFPKWSQSGIPLAFMMCHVVFLTTLIFPMEIPEALHAITSILGPLIFSLCLIKMRLVSKNSLVSPSKKRMHVQQIIFDRIFSETDPKRVKVSLVIKEYYLVVLGACILPIFYGIVAQIYTEFELNNGLFDVTMETLSIIALLGMSLLSYTEKGRQYLDRILFVLLPIIATALVVAGDQFLIAGTIVKCLNIIFLAVFWCFLALKSGADGRKVYFFFGIAQGTTHLSAMIGRMLGHSMNEALGTSIEISLTVILVVIWMLACVSWFILSRRTKQDTSNDQNRQTIMIKREMAQSSAFEEACIGFAHSVGLSSREQEILLLFVHGRSAAFIAEELFISHNTAKTHLRNIYTKAGVHSRQELLDLIEGK